MKKLKKISAILVSVVMAAMMMTACGDSDSSSKSDKSSKKDTSSVAATDSDGDEDSKTEDSKDESKEEESTPDESKEPAPDESEDESKGGDVNTDEMGPLTAAFIQKMAGKKFTAEVETQIAGLNMGSGFTIKCNGDDSYVTASVSGMNIEVYTVGGKTVTVIPSLNAYMEGAMEGMNMSVGELNVPSGFSYKGSSEEEGKTVESYEDSNGYTYKYFFGSDGNPTKIAATSGGSESVVNFKSISFDAPAIELPDTSGMTVYDPSAAASSPTEAIKSALSMLGVTEEALKKAGYTYEQLAELDQDQLMEVISQISNIDLSQLGL
ncbi:MAG: hypothetical protein IKP47_04890 [Ruminococcus sp.]|nr:hypothetical protein [Ruminococcus sp.]